MPFIKHDSTIPVKGMNSHSDASLFIDLSLLQSVNQIPSCCGQSNPLEKKAHPGHNYLLLFYFYNVSKTHCKD